MLQTVLPSYDTYELIDLRALSYVGEDPEIEHTSIFQGPHGIPFYLEAKPSRGAAESHGKKPLDAMSVLDTRQNNAEGTIGWVLKHNMLVKMGISGHRCRTFRTIQKSAPSSSSRRWPS